MLKEKSSAKYIVPALMLLIGNEVLSWFALVLIAGMVLWSILMEVSGSA